MAKYPLISARKITFKRNLISFTSFLTLISLVFKPIANNTDALLRLLYLTASVQDYFLPPKSIDGKVISKFVKSKDIRFL